MSTAKPSFLIKIKKHDATNLLDSELIRRAMKMLDECGDVLEVQSNGSGGVVAAPRSSSSICRLGWVIVTPPSGVSQFMLLEGFGLFCRRAAWFNAMLEPS